MAKNSQQFQTIRSEGAILPPDILRRVASLTVKGATPDAYHLPPGSKINEAISRSWTTLLAHWQAFQEARENVPDTDETATAVTNERWLLPLFKELDFGRLLTTDSPEIDGRVYQIKRFYNHTPIHLIGCKLTLDRRTKGARGAATASPHSMVQEFLNRSEEHLWAFVSNGLQLRILRDNISLSRQAFVEFDLEAMMEGEVYPDFALLWLLCHQSRIEAEKPAECWLEKWSHLAREQGTRVLKDLRKGVANSIEALGRGCIGHPRNDQLREKLRTGTLSKDDFYRQLLRTVYRLLFLFVAEDRELLHPPESPEDACKLYDTHYSTRRLRELAHKIRGSKHADLWHSLSLVFDALDRDEGRPELGLCGLGSFLWQSSSTSDLLGPGQLTAETDDAVEPVLISNDDLLQAVRSLAYVEQDRMLRIVDYRNLGSEELGSVYESLLELHPVMNPEAKAFELDKAAGNERKKTGSYYTPDSLVQCLLDSALDPVVAERLKGKRGEEAEQAILDLKVCDPACGSGHFLIAASHRLARHLARVRTGETEPSPDDYQHALRDIIGHCIYGVDINPMAVELCKVSLWMEAIEPGRPLSFLEHHIRCGNSLLGTTPALLSRGLPDDAFKPIEGDDKKYCTEWKKQNKKERQGYRDLFEEQARPWDHLGDITATFHLLDEAADDSIEGVHEKEQRYRELTESSGYLATRFWADAWCAAFVWRKCPEERGGFDYPITQDTLKRIRANPHDCPPWMREEVIRLAKQYQFFHWHIAFPDVFHAKPDEQIDKDDKTGWEDGFDVVLGNPPWEKTKLLEKEWFANRDPNVAESKTAALRRKRIKELATNNPELFELYSDAARSCEAQSHIIRGSGRYPLCGIGEINTFAVFAEVAGHLLSSSGRMGCVLPPGICTDDTYKRFVAELLDSRSLIAFYAFTNRGYIFRDVESTMSFSLLVVGYTDADQFNAAAKLWQVSHLHDEGRVYQLGYDDIKLINPNTKNLPIFQSHKDAALVSCLHRRYPVLLNESSTANPWNIQFQRMFDMSNDSEDFKSYEQLVELYGHPVGNVFEHLDKSLLPLFESKLVEQFNHRAATFEGTSASERFGTRARTNKSTLAQLSTPYYRNYPRHWIDRSLVCERSGNRRWLIGFRNAISAVADSRSVVVAVVPLLGVGNSMPLFFCGEGDPVRERYLLATLNSFMVDYLIRQKASGGNLNYYILKQLAIPTPNAFMGGCSWDRVTSFSIWIQLRILELTYTAWDLEAFAQDCGYDGPPFTWDGNRRFDLRCELDAAYFHLYLSTEEEWEADSPELKEIFPKPRDAVEHIMETFPIVKRRDIKRTEVKNDAGEVVQEGTYITKDTILEIYDEMTEAIRTGQAYQTRLDPPPGPPARSDGTFIPMAQWDQLDPHLISHIHPPKEAEEEWPEIDEEALEEMSYPITAADRAICDAAIEIIAQGGSMSSMDHLDASLIATHPAWCEAFLSDDDKVEFQAARNTAPGELFVSTETSIHWADCRDHIERLERIAVNRQKTGQPISPGSLIGESQTSGLSSLISFVLRAIARIHELRGNLEKASPAERAILEQFAVFHLEYSLAG
jgi:hypothetical protein